MLLFRASFRHYQLFVIVLLVLLNSSLLIASAAEQNRSSEANEHSDSFENDPNTRERRTKFFERRKSVDERGGGESILKERTMGINWPKVAIVFGSTIGGLAVVIFTIVIALNIHRNIVNKAKAEDPQGQEELGVGEENKKEQPQDISSPQPTLKSPSFTFSDFSFGMLASLRSQTSIKMKMPNKHQMPPPVPPTTSPSPRPSKNSVPNSSLVSLCTVHTQSSPSVSPGALNTTTALCIPPSTSGVTSRVLPTQSSPSSSNTTNDSEKAKGFRKTKGSGKSKEFRKQMTSTTTKTYSTRSRSTKESVDTDSSTGKSTKESMNTRKSDRKDSHEKTFSK